MKFETYITISAHARHKMRIMISVFAGLVLRSAERYNKSRLMLKICCRWNLTKYLCLDTPISSKDEGHRQQIH